MKKTIVAFLITIMTIAVFTVPVYASDKLTNDDTLCRSAITSMVKAENNHDWDSFCALFTSEQTAALSSFFRSQETGGVKRVQSAELVEVQPLDHSLNTLSTGMNQRRFIIGVEHTVETDDIYYYNGVNYSLISLVKENGEWKIDEYSAAPLGEYIQISGNKTSLQDEARSITGNLNKLNADNVAKALNIIKARMTGIVVDTEGKYVSSLRDDVSTAKGAAPILESLKRVSTRDVHYRRPTSIKLLHKPPIGSGTETLNFLTYCKNVLPNEWIGSWPAESLKAGGLAVMQYGTYYSFNPKHLAQGCAVCDNTGCQVYRKNTSIASCNNAVEAVKAYYYCKYARGPLFVTYYAAGNENSTGKAGGQMKQKGTKYWANQGKNWKWMVDYYYSNSNKDGVSIGKVAIETYQ